MDLGDIRRKQKPSILSANALRVMPLSHSRNVTRYSDRSSFRLNISYDNAELFLVGAISELICNQNIEETSMILSYDCIINVVTKYTDQLILDIGGCVCGISSCTLKVVPQDRVSN